MQYQLDRLVLFHAPPSLPFDVALTSEREGDSTAPLFGCVNVHDMIPRRSRLNNRRNILRFAGRLVHAGAAPRLL